MAITRYHVAVSSLAWPAFILVIILFLGIARLVYLLPAFRPRPPRTRSRKQDAGYILVVLGSGGHTTEMFMLLRDLDTSLYPTRRYVISEGDNHSIMRMKDFETRLELVAARNDSDCGTYDFRIVPRARKIHQSLYSTPRTAIATFLTCLRVFGRAQNSVSVYPDLVIANGPANALMLICAAFLLRYLRLSGTRHSLRCVYVESWARLSRLSLTGQLLRTFGLCDRFLVQWPSLEDHGPKKKHLGEFHGPLVI